MKYSLLQLVLETMNGMLVKYVSGFEQLKVENPKLGSIIN